MTGEIEIRVRYAETDRMGLLHHANYLVYFEQGRTELLRSQGFAYKDLEDGGPEVLRAGQRVTVRATVENQLAPGRYYVKSWVFRDHNYGDIVHHAPHVIDFVVFGAAEAGVVALDSEVSFEVGRDA